jgi:hypothetical protein
LSLPTVEEVRQRIESIKREEIRYAVKTAYLYAGRISEVVGHASPSDNTTARGPKGTDAHLDMIEGHEAVLFSVWTAKRYRKKSPQYSQGLERVVALPVEFEPWAKEVYEYFKKAGNNKVFPFTRQFVSKNLGKVFDGFSCPIEYYRIIRAKLEQIETEPYREKGWEIEQDEKTKLYRVINAVEKHVNDFTLHSLRHLRATELRRFYHFKAEDLGAYCGWTLMTVNPQISPVMQRYQDLSMDYLEYFPKLLKRRCDSARQLWT